MKKLTPEQHNDLHWLSKDKYASIDPAAIPDKDVRRIMKGEPVDYVIGWKPFLNCHIDLSKRPLIPRVETEYWTEKFIEAHRDTRRAIHILDMFAGSGCIGIAILKNIPNARVDFADYDPRCIAQIKINLRKNGISPKRTRVIRSDVFSAWKSKPEKLTTAHDRERLLTKFPNRYDAIVANPPYVPASRKKQLPRSVTAFEPHLAVFGENDGLKYIRTFLRDARAHLNPHGLPPHQTRRVQQKNQNASLWCGGVVWMEFDTKEHRAIAALAKRFGYARCEFKKDQYGKIRYVILS